MTPDRRRALRRRRLSHPLPTNPLPARIDLGGSLKFDLPLDGGAMAMMMRGGNMMGTPGAGRPAQPTSIWSIANTASDGHSGKPLFSVARGRTVDARARQPHRISLTPCICMDIISGCSTASTTAAKPFWLNSIVVPKRQTQRIAFVADNPASG